MDPGSAKDSRHQQEQPGFVDVHFGTNLWRVSNFFFNGSALTPPPSLMAAETSPLEKKVRNFFPFLARSLPPAPPPLHP